MHVSTKSSLPFKKKSMDILQTTANKPQKEKQNIINHPSAKCNPYHFTQLNREYEI